LNALDATPLGHLIIRLVPPLAIIIVVVLGFFAKRRQGASN